MKLDKETLNRLYWKEQKSLFEIGKIFNLKSATIQYHMRKNSIKRRTFREGFDVKYRNCRSIINCEVCGKDFKVIKSKVHRAKKLGTKIRFCSIACKHIGMKGIHLKKNEDISDHVIITHRLRKSIGICQICGIEEPKILTLHHKDRNRKNNKKENLVALCKDCHVAVHHGITGNINLSKNTNKTGHHGRQRTYQENSPEGKKIKELQKFWWDAVKNKKEI